MLYANDAFYVFFRLHQYLYDRYAPWSLLLRIKALLPSVSSPRKSVPSIWSSLIEGSAMMWLMQKRGTSAGTGCCTSKSGVQCQRHSSAPGLKLPLHSTTWHAS